MEVGWSWDEAKDGSGEGVRMEAGTELGMETRMELEMAAGMELGPGTELGLGTETRTELGPGTELGTELGTETWMESEWSWGWRQGRSWMESGMDPGMDPGIEPGTRCTYMVTDMFAAESGLTSATSFAFCSASFWLAASSSSCSSCKARRHV